MKNLVIMKNRQAVTTSLQVAEAFDKQHKDVMDTIRHKLQSAENSAHYQKMFALGTYQDSRGRTQNMYYMNRSGWSFIAMGFTGEKADSFKLAYIDAFDAMQDELKHQNELVMTPEQKLDLLIETGSRANHRIDHVEERMDDFEANRRLESGDYTSVSHGVSKAVREYIQDRHLQLTQEQRSALYKDINGGLNQVCGVRTRTQIREKDFDKAMQYIDDWSPSTATKMMMQQAGEQTAMEV
ncbi:Rha family transcriptional regulator [Levilactobacillus spicheri]|uniref:ORF6C domain-containing protein n=2 Tax=Levilactobacillus spicheri TaxID=216463 RepID=A0ABQ0WSC7_9LACO|nr:Rha family transcriptional regulator [Levilactobacillus spicheri]KRL47276.1 phage anti-repressor protein [Levilactobacillus spicheri DSM 15429]GEO68002.1 hypothetical protein LSP04_24210 [Levilactobacillus spicheri]